MRNIESVFLHFIAEGVPADSQKPGCLRLIAVRPLKRLDEQAFLMSFERRVVGKFNWLGGMGGAWGVRPQVFRKILHVDRLAYGHNAPVSENVLKLSHIAGPVVAGEDDLRTLCKAANLLLELARKFLKKVPRQERQIVFPLRQ